MNLLDYIERIISREGGFIVDQGGPTNFGITIPAYVEFCGTSISSDDIKAITPDKARKFYLWWFNRYGLQYITNTQLLDLIFDSTVNHGPVVPVKWLQQALGVRADGKLGYITAAALQKADIKTVYYKVLQCRIRYYTDIVIDNPAKNLISLRGWINRVNTFIKEI